VKETETTEAPKEETKDEVKPADKVKISRRISTRITGFTNLFAKRDAKSKEEAPAATEEEPPKLAEVAASAPLEEPKPEVGLYLLLISAFTRSCSLTNSHRLRLILPPPPGRQLRNTSYSVRLVIMPTLRFLFFLSLGST